MTRVFEVRIRNGDNAIENYVSFCFVMNFVDGLSE